MNIRFRSVSFAALLALSFGMGATAQEITITALNGSATFTGTLISSDAETLTIKTGVGPMTLSHSNVRCDGAGCPVVQTSPSEQTSSAVVVVHGSDTVGKTLFPLLLKGYAQEKQANVSQEMNIGDAHKRFYLNEQFGAGEPLLNVDFKASNAPVSFRQVPRETTKVETPLPPEDANTLDPNIDQVLDVPQDLPQEYVVAVDSILTVVSPGNPVHGLTAEQKAGLFSGRIKNWNEVGGIDLPVTVYTRDEKAGTRGVFEKVILDPINATFSPNAIMVKSNRQMSERVTADPGAIGYVSIASLGMAKSVNLITSCGINVGGTEFAAKTEEYPIDRRLRLFTDNGPLNPDVEDLLEYAVSSKADALVQQAGFVDLGVTLRQTGDGTANFNFQEYADVPSSYPYMTNLINTLARAERLSTTFRFETGSASLDSKAKRDISRVIAFLNKPENVDRKVIFAGYTDSVGGFTRNGELSNERAAAALAEVLQHPLAKGLKRSRFKAVGFSELSPVACNDTEEGQRRNRRVELWLN